MAIPDYETLMLPLLRIAAEAKGQEVQLLTAVGRLVEEFNLSDDERAELLPSGSTFKFSSRVSWARTYLQKAMLLEAVRRGHIRITPRGLDVLQKNPARVDNRLLLQFAEFKAWKNPRRDVSSDAAVSETPIESIATHYDQLRDALSTDLLDRIKKCSPQFFERLVIRVLVAMGYGGSLKDAGQALGRSGDGGIDGVIREDKLGLDNIYIQAKRWAEKSVGSPDIDQFAGALSKKKATKGIFITTSSFTKDALASVREYSSRIILVDGETLANYMIDYNVGVSVASVYEIKRIDSDFFEEGD